MEKKNHTEREVLDRCGEFHRELMEMIGDIHSHGEGEVGVIFGTARAALDGRGSMDVSDRTVTISGNTGAIAHVIAEVFVRYPSVHQMTDALFAEMTRRMTGCN